MLRNIQMKLFLLSVGFLILFTFEVPGQHDSVSLIREYRTANEHKLLGEFVEMLAIPNVASDTANIRRNADYLFDLMKRRGLGPRLLTTADSRVPPAVYGESLVPGARQTLIIYAHYDGQPT